MRLPWGQGDGGDERNGRMVFSAPLRVLRGQIGVKVFSPTLTKRAPALAGARLASEILTGFGRFGVRRGGGPPAGVYHCSWVTVWFGSTVKT